ncbi:MAG: ECF transporter S component [Oscillospiraceae bacterium]|nr:ECF transporter S component [Oscillospiraceae bacterium]
MKQYKKINYLIFFLAIPLTLIFGSRLSGKSYYLVSTMIVMELLVPFFLSFEGRKPQARELVLLSVMCALAVAARVAVPIPNFKAIFGMIMIAGIAFGPESGFLVGAVAALASNFFFTQGPYTPWQMMAYGVGGMLAGLLFRKGRLPRKPLVMAVAGFICITVIVGPLLDTCTLFLAPVTMRLETVLAIYLSGMPGNISQGISTFLVLMLLGKAFLEKLDRIQVKYGLLENVE